MAKSKNHTAHNQTYKAHRRGIKKPVKQRYMSLKGVRETQPMQLLLLSSLLEHRRWCCGVCLYLRSRRLLRISSFLWFCES